LKRVAIVQSNYVPWKGYFDLIASVDEFVLFDDMQYTRRDWRNRNRIKTPSGLQWLTVPVQVKGRFEQPVRGTLIDGSAWGQHHWKALALNYGRAPAFEATAAWLEPFYRQIWTHLSVLNRALIEAVCARLSITTRLSNSWDYTLTGERSERLASICEQAHAGVYVSGPSARGYLDEAAFARRGMAVEWFDYAGYPEYPQGWGTFEHHVSILDLLFHCGDDARRFALRKH
jgi:WbqC-like protein family